MIKIISCVKLTLYIKSCTALEKKLAKKRDLERQLREAGWRFARHGGNHDAWTNGELFEFVPRHAEVKEMLAKKILKKAKANPPKEN